MIYGCRDCGHLFNDNTGEWVTEYRNGYNYEGEYLRCPECGGLWYEASEEEIQDLIADALSEKGIHSELIEEIIQFEWMEGQDG